MGLCLLFSFCFNSFLFYLKKKMAHTLMAYIEALDWSIYWSRSFLDGWIHCGDFGYVVSGDYPAKVDVNTRSW
jgi:hypothetical protein